MHLSLIFLVVSIVMYKVAGVSFKKNSKIYLFLVQDIDPLVNDEVIVETEKGLQYGTISYFKEFEEEDFSLKKILRIATEEDKKKHQKNIKDAEKALEDAKKLASRFQLPMRIIDANFTFDRNQLLFNFLADDRVDFRELAKKLAQIYKTRIELRQIGVRDKAKEIGGLGPCGRFLCCNSFLTDFNSVSINMAKNQMLALNPSKINGVCGRLLCCLNYEDQLYSEMKVGLPKIGELYESNEVKGKVVGINIWKRTVTVEQKNHSQVEVEVE